MTNKEVLCHRLDDIFSSFFIDQIKTFDWDNFEGMVMYAKYYNKFLIKIKDGVMNDFINISEIKKDNNYTPNLILRNVRSLFRLMKG